MGPPHLKSGNIISPPATSAFRFGEDPLEAHLLKTPSRGTFVEDPP